MSRVIERFTYSICFASAMFSMNFVNPPIDSDILWSMAIGKWITINQAFPIVDSFSWTINGKEWITHEWLFAFLAYRFNLLFGNLGLYVLAIIPMTITIYILYIMCREYDVNKSYCFLLILTFGTALLYTMTSPLRAYIYGLLFFTILIYLLYFKDRSSADWFYLAILFCVWANFHATVCMGIIILLIEMIRRLIIYQDIKAIWIILTSSAATLINPYGYKIWAYLLFSLIGMGEAKSIAEWQAPDFNSLAKLTLYLILASTVIIMQNISTHCYKANKQNEKSKNQDICIDSSVNVFKRAAKLLYDFACKYFTDQTCLLVLFWGFYIYSLYSIRMIFYTIIIWIIVTSYYVGKTNRLNFTIRANYIFIGVFILFIARNLIISDLSYQNVLVSNNNIAPVVEVNFLKENPSFQNHLLNDYIFGGYLILNDIPVFIDARSDSYIKFGVQKKYCDIIHLQEDPQPILDELGVKNILIFNDTPFEQYLKVNQGWKLVYKGPTSCIFTASAGYN